MNKKGFAENKKKNMYEKRVKKRLLFHGERLEDYLFLPLAVK